MMMLRLEFHALQFCASLLWLLQEARLRWCRNWALKWEERTSKGENGIVCNSNYLLHWPGQDRIGSNSISSHEFASHSLVLTFARGYLLGKSREQAQESHQVSPSPLPLLTQNGP